jgi:hypothetical protein
MIRRVRWTHNPVDHLVNIYEYNALNSPAYAKPDHLSRNKKDRLEVSAVINGTRLPPDVL